MTEHQQHKAISLADSKILQRALLDSFRKLDPRTMIKNPVMFVVEVGALLTTIQLAIGASIFICRPCTAFFANRQQWTFIS